MLYLDDPDGSDPSVEGGLVVCAEVLDVLPRLGLLEARVLDSEGVLRRGLELLLPTDSVVHLQQSQLIKLAADNWVAPCPSRTLNGYADVNPTTI